MITVFGFLCFIVAFFVHVVWWRFSKPTNTTLTITLIFGFSVFVVWVMIVGFGIPQVFSYASPADHTLILFLALALSVSYISTYPALENDSPTLRVVFVISKYGSVGISEHALYKMFSNEDLVQISITEMENERLVYRDGNLIVLTKTGHRLANLFWRWRNILGAGTGG